MSESEPSESTGKEIERTATLDELLQRIPQEEFVPALGQTPAVSFVALFASGQYVIPREPKCHFCQMPNELYLFGERLRIEGHGYTAITKELFAYQQILQIPVRLPSVASTREHFVRNHMNVRAETRNKLIAAEAQLQGIDETIESVIITPRLVTNTLISDGWQAYLRGEIKMTGSLWLSVLRMGQHQAEVDANDNFDRDTYIAAMQRTFEVLDMVAPEEVKINFGRAIENDPQLLAFMARMQSS